MRKINFMNQAVIATLLSATGMMAWAQSTTSVIIPLEAKTYEKLAGEDMARVNLINEAKRINPALKAIPNLEIQMIRLEAKSGMGGAQVFLRINNEMMDSQVVETDPALLNSLDPRSFQKVELKNIDRNVVNEASPVIQAFSNTRIRSLELIMGPVQEPVVFGRYADDQIAQIGGMVTSNETEGNIDDTRPSAEIVNAVYNRYYYQDPAALDAYGQPIAATNVQQVPAVSVVQAPIRPVCAIGFDLAFDGLNYSCVRAAYQQPVAVQQPVRQAVPVRQCVMHKKRYEICVGDRVKNSWGFPGIVRAVNLRTNEVTAKFEFREDVVTRNVDSYSK